MNRGGRPKNSVWEELNYIVNRENGKIYAFCAGCNRVLSNTAEERLRNHRKKCILVDEILVLETDPMDVDKSVNNSKMSGICEISEEILMNNNNIDDESISSNMNKSCQLGEAADALSSCSATVSAPHFPARPTATRQKSIKAFVDAGISEKEKSYIDKALANLIFARNIELDVVDSNYFKQLIRILRPSYIPPTFEMLSTTLLDKAFETYSNSNTKKNKENKSYGILFLNEVKHKNAEIILGIIRDTNGNTYFLQDFEISHQESRERDQEFLRIAVEAIKLANENYCVDSFGFKGLVRAMQY